MHCRDFAWSVFLPTSLIASLLLLSATGCQTFDTNVASLLGAEPVAEPAGTAPPDPNSPAYYVEYRAEKKKPVILALPLNDSVFVQNVIDQTGTLKKFRRFKIEVYRHLPQGGGHKIPVHYDRHHRRVDPSTDYAIHARDRVVITEDTSTILDDMLETLSSGGMGI